MHVMPILYHNVHLDLHTLSITHNHFCHIISLYHNILLRLLVISLLSIDILKFYKIHDGY
jgi:hypothetical protein